ncbi:MAG: 1-(5-phosphoribosyl)-5-amino-4-imidazole-carboxylate carboxylase [Gemmatimonadetes bacterium]|nr:MAG: 1-(5-phosphoribosyl)-5-amino-4-imidazole-carboxylate carboxylase [Gemmatimonadota bacterium]
MIRARVRTLLAEVAAGTSSIDDALSRLDSEPIETLAHTTIDHHRALRSGYPEVVYGSGKTVEQVIEICASISERSAHFLVTRTTAEQREALVSRFVAAIASDIARTVRWSASGRPDVDSRGDRPRGRVLIVTAGTSDLAVAEEASETLAALGIGADRLVDVGVAGIHRLLAKTEALQEAAAVIVVAGMDGALPSVVGGLVRVPVIAVPTSVGYGASFGGLAALLTMLNSCAAGVVVCNIDNGFGAAMAAARAIGA